MATIIEQLQSILDKDTNVKVKEALQKRPDLVIDDALASHLVSIFDGAPAEVAAATTNTTATPATTTAAVHTPTVPSTASSAAAPVTPAPSSTTTTNNNSEILTALAGLKSTMETNFKNVITKEQLPELGRELRTQ